MNRESPAGDIAILESACLACRRLHHRGLLAASDGNVSVRLPGSRLAMSPAGLSKARMRPEDLALLRSDGATISGHPSSERLMHLEVYHHCPEAGAVVHAHPPLAIAWTLARPDLREIPTDALPEAILAVGRIPVAPYHLPGTEALAKSLVPYLPAHRLIVLARHGAVAWGETLEEACDGLERLEHICQILLSAKVLGGARPLPPWELEALRTLREKLGPRLR